MWLAGKSIQEIGLANKKGIEYFRNYDIINSKGLKSLRFYNVMNYCICEAKRMTFCTNDKISNTADL